MTVDQLDAKIRFERAVVAGIAAIFFAVVAAYRRDATWFAWWSLLTVFCASGAARSWVNGAREAYRR